MSLLITGWTKFDSLLIGILAFSVVLSLVKGLTRELISLGAAIWGFLFAAWFYQDLGERLTPFARNADIAAFTAFALIFLFCLISGGFLSRLAGRAVDRAGIRTLDRVLGASFGLLRGFLVSVVLILALTVFDVGQSTVARSQLAPYLIHGARVMVTLSPADMRERFRRGYTRVKRLWSERPRQIVKGDLT